MWLFSLESARAGFDPVFAPELALDGEKSCGGSFLDFDGDGDWDLVAPADDAVDGVRLLRNDGAIDAWTDVTEDLAPDLFAPSEVRGLLPADLTNDGWTDLVRVGTDELTVHVNDGPPDFTFVTTWRFPGPDQGFEGTAILDHDGDGWLDVLVTHASTANWILYNLGGGTFSAVDQVGLLTGTNSDFATVGDWDGDGAVDVVIRGEGVADAFLGGPNGWSVVPGFDLDGSNLAKGTVSLCDVRGTGALDLFWTTPLEPGVLGFSWSGAWDPLVVALNEPTGVHGATCGDVDNDGFLDLWLADDDEDDLLLGPDFRAGTGGGGGDTQAVSLADLDRDGDLDAYLVDDLGPNVLLRNPQDDDDWLQVRLLANVGGCPTPVLRDDIGGSIRVLDATGVPQGSLVELSGGMGRGQVAWPVLHVGGVDPLVDHRLSFDFRFRGEGVVRLPAGTHEITVVSDDPDGDGLSDAWESDADTDGDGFADRLDDDADGDGIPDRDEHTGGPCDPPIDTDGDDVPDVLDTDSDDDGLPDGVDPDPLDGADEPVDPVDPGDDDDDDGGEDPEPDSDGDGIPDAVDPSPNDAGGSPTVEAPPTPAGCGCATGLSFEWMWLASMVLLAVRGPWMRRAALL